MNDNGFRLAHFPWRVGQRFGVMVSDDEKTWRRACGAVATADNKVTFDDPVAAGSGRYMLLANEEPPADIGVFTEVTFYDPNRVDGQSEQ